MAIGSTGVAPHVGEVYSYSCSTGVAPHVGEVYSYRFSVFLNTFFSVSYCYSSCFVNSPTDHNSQRILTYDGSKNVVWREDVSFGYPKR